MVCGARSGSSSRRSLRGRVLFQASTSGSSSVPPPVAAAASLAFVSPPVATEPAQASQFITRTIQAQFPGLIHRFNDFSMEVQELLYQMFMSNHRFTRHSDEVRSRLVWTMTARSNFKHLLYNARKNAHKVSQSADPTLWRERAPTWMRRDYWESLCNIWAAERWQQTFTTMKVNRVANPEANMHTSGSVSFATHQSRLEKELKRPPTFQDVFDKTHKKMGTDQYLSDRAREVAERVV
ncbi:hypothetical protein Taro_025276 [Colocasia esculenta]|uniref:Uncharacterized protein n=1 Tax=Colocasia esculenta TaxID=4460 RepID=A0A843VMW4_COLES|nr:hypothetical protein [Colocasia esculenta]